MNIILLNEVQTTLDIFMTIAWTITYVLCVIGIIIYKKRIIPTYFFTFNFAIEIACLIYFCIHKATYLIFIYSIWALLEIAMIVLFFRYHLLNKKNIIQHALLLAANVLIAMYLIMEKKQMTVINYLYALIGVIIWYIGIFKKDYPLRALTLIIFVIKFLADASVIYTYFDVSKPFVDVVCIALPALDFTFIPTYFILKRRNKFVLNVNEEKDVC